MAITPCAAPDLQHHLAVGVGVGVHPELGAPFDASADTTVHGGEPPGRGEKA